MGLCNSTTHSNIASQSLKNDNFQLWYCNGVSSKHFANKTKYNTYIIKLY